MFYITLIVDFTYQCDNKIIAKEKMWLKEKMRNDMKFTEIKKKFFDYFREKENGAMSINTKETTQRVCYTNRELSWLAFNERVLNEAANPKVPLAERLTFASIYQTNLDEFFMVRVGTLMMQMQLQEKERDNKTGMTSEEQVKAILDKVSELEKKKGRVYEQLMGELETAGIRIINFNKLSNDEGAMLEEYFDMHIAPFLSPMIIGQQQPFPFLANKQLYAIVLMKTKKGKNKIGIVPCSNSVFKRLIEIPTRPGTFMLSEELILHFVSKLYEKYEIQEKSVMRVIRNADIDAGSFDDEDLDYRNMMEHMVKQRNRLNPVCVQLNREINDKAKKKLTDYLEIGAKHLIEERTPLDMSFVFQLQNVLKNKPELFYKKRVPQPSKEISMNEKIIPQIEKKDVVLSYPFESMRPFISMLEEAANDPTVVSIKMTLYRVADRSKIVETLIEAAENGKEVIVLVELRARFDEANNIEMSKRLEEAGCQLLYGLGEYKVHSKLCLITRSVNNTFSYITQIGTGNYNEKTSRLYTDLSLITANEEIGADAAAVFAALQKGETVDSSNQLLVAPNCLQNRILSMIDEQIDKAKNGQEGYVGVKINSLTDKLIIEKLIEASQAGVKIDLEVRGICCIKPGVKGYTDNIRVVSVVGRFLEHSRIYRFGRGDDQKIYIASADFMTRNTTRRVEVAAPVLDKHCQERIIHIFDLIMQDDEKGKEQNSDGIYCDRHINNPKIDSQETLYEESYEAAASAE